MRRLLLGAAALALLLGSVAYADPTPSPTPTDAGTASVKILVTSLLPRAPEPGDAFELKGEVRNTGSVTLQTARVVLGLGKVVSSRGALAADDDPGNRPATDLVTATQTGLVTSIKVRFSQRTEVPDLAPGQRAYFDVRTDIRTLGLDTLGVYPLDVELRADAGPSGGRETVDGTVPTWVPFFPERPIRNKVAVLWPLVDRPHQGPDDSFLDDDLATSLSEKGRLGRLLIAARGSEQVQCATGATGADGTVTPAPTGCTSPPITYALDPDLLSAVTAMTSKYRVKGESKPGTGGPAASAWLANLKARLSSGSVLALPYADPDVNALAVTAAGKVDLAKAQKLGSSVVSSALGVTPLGDVAWPPPGGLSDNAIDALFLAPSSPDRRSRPTAVVLDSTAFAPLSSDLTAVPAARLTLSHQPVASGPVSGLVADPTLSTLVTGSTSGQYGTRVAEQRFIAETALAAAELSGTSRTFLIAPPRGSDVNTSAAADDLRDLGRLPWLCPVTLESVVQDSEGCEAGVPDPSAPTTNWGDVRPAARGQLGQGYLGMINTDDTNQVQFTSYVLDGQSQTDQNEIAALQTRLQQAVFRAQSTAWRGNTAGAEAMAELLKETIGNLTSQVTVAGGRLLLTSSKGTLQANVSNSLDLPIKVRVQFSAANNAILTRETGFIQVPGRKAVTASVKATAQKSGRFVVKVQMYDDNTPQRTFQTYKTIIVRSTQYGRFALGLTFAAGAVLFVAAGLRIYRRARYGADPPASA